MSAITRWTTHGGSWCRGWRSRSSLVYIPPGSEQAPEAFHGIGIRIEDDVLVTRDEPEVLTAACPKSVEDIEALMARNGVSG